VASELQPQAGPGDRCGFIREEAGTGTGEAGCWSSTVPTGTSLQQMDSAPPDFGGAAWKVATKIWFSPAPTRYRRFAFASSGGPVVM